MIYLQSAGCYSRTQVGLLVSQVVVKSTFECISDRPTAVHSSLKEFKCQKALNGPIIDYL